MTGKDNFDRVMRKRSQRQPRKNPQFSGFLGIRTGGINTVNVDSRPGFVWVRLRNVDNEVIQAFNESTSTIYNLPVLVERDLSSPNRYKIVGRDIGVYGSNWGTASPYLAAHAGQHSFNKADTSTGGDIVWVYSDQFLPFLVTPSGTAGAGNALVFPGVYSCTGTFHYAGNTGTSDLLGYKPTGTTASLLLISLDEPTGNFIVTSAGAGFNVNLTGTHDVVTNLPAPPSNNLGLSGVRLVSGTSVIGWNNLYDVRDFLGACGGAGGGSSSSFLGLTDTKVAYDTGSILFWNGSLVDEWENLKWDDTQKVLLAGESLTYSNSDHSAVFGEANSVSGSFNLVAGDSNEVIGKDSLVTNYNSYVNGIENSVLAPNSTVVGQVNFIGGGDSNKIYNDESAILGGYEGEIYGYMGTILGGNSVMVSGSYAMAYGNVAHADHDGSIVFAAGQYGDNVFPSIREDEFAVRATGGFRFVTASGTSVISPGGDTYWTGAGSGLPYGSMYTNDAIAVTLTVQNTWYEINAAQAWTVGPLNLCTFTDPYITVKTAGTYMINWSISGNIGTANQGIGVGIMLDQTTVQNMGQARTMFLNAARNMNMGGTAIITLTANQKVSLCARNITSGAKVFTTQKGSLTISMIGG